MANDIKLPEINLNGLAGSYANNYLYKGVENPLKSMFNTTYTFNNTGELPPNNGQLPSNKAYSMVDINNAPSVLNEKGLNAWTNQEATKVDTITPNSRGLAYNSIISGPNAWTPEQWQNFGAQGGTIDSNNNLQFGTNNMQTGITKEPGMFDWLGSDNMKGVGTIGGLAMSGLGIFNTMNAQKEAKRQWEAENARADEIMAMNREKYNQYKADRDRLNTGYGGK